MEPGEQGLHLATAILSGSRRVGGCGCSVEAVVMAVVSAAELEGVKGIVLQACTVAEAMWFWSWA